MGQTSDTQYRHHPDPGLVLLDSTLEVTGRGARSAVVRDPREDWTYSTGVARMGDQAARRSTLDQFLDELSLHVEATGSVAVGYITYEAMLEFLGLIPIPDRWLIPGARFYLYDALSWVDGPLQLSEPPEASPSRKEPQAACSVSKARYLDDVARIKHHLHEGDIYQANYTCRWEVVSDLDPYFAYARLRERNPSPYGAYLDFGEYQILSSSPERMIRWSGGVLSTSPIKGTTARGRTADEDRDSLNRLLASEKDRAEHLMIVDLERNDLGKLAEPGTVRVDRFCQPELYANLIHLVSDISARVDPAVPLGVVMRAMLPGGSITGAPKRRAVEILRGLESVPRSVYTGCIGYISSEAVEFNIAIRTMLRQNDVYYAYAGGGIVADSDPSAEYEEMLLKVERQLRAVGVSHLPESL